MNTILKKVKLVLLLLLLIGIWISADLGYNFLFSLIPEVNDGITVSGFWTALLLPDHGWSRIGYLKLFRNATCFTAVIASAVIGIDVCTLIRELKK